MYLEPGWCQLFYVMICSWLWTKFTKGRLLYRVSIQSFVMKVVAGAVGCKPSRCCFLFYFTNSLCFMWAPRCASLQPFLAWKFETCFFHRTIFNVIFIFIHSSHVCFCIQWILPSYTRCRSLSDATMQQLILPELEGRLFPWGLFWTQSPNRWRPLPSLQHCLCSSSLRAQTLVKGFDMKN